MDCDDAMLLLAGGSRTLSGREETGLQGHLGTCTACRELAAESRGVEWRWLARIPADAVDKPLLGLVSVDPVVFGARTEIASGGMGRITRAFDRRLGREVAVKEILDHGLRERFEREVRITARLQHPAIVTIYEAGTFPDGSSFYTMPLVPGRTLQDAITEAGSLEQRLRLMPHVRALTDALGYAHSHGVIHRDLKPANVLVGGFGETVVIDWGLAKDRDGDPDDAYITKQKSQDPHLTRVGTVIGTPCYMSPAQAAGEQVDATDDVYALGAILYTVLAGDPPYWDNHEHDSEALMAATVDGPPTPIAQLAPEAPEDLCTIVERAMARAKTQRFATAKELAEELARFEAGQLLLSRAYTPRELFVRWLRRNRRAITLASVGVVVVALLGVVWLRYRRTADALATQVRGGELAALYRDVSRQAYQIDRDLLRMESALEGLTTAASDALGGPEPAPSEMYFTADFADGHTPRDFTKQTAYRWPVSVEFPVIGLAPDTDRAAVMPKLQRIAPLRHFIHDMVLEAAVPDPTGLSAEDANAKLVARASPIDYAYVDLDEGVHMVWPGMANLRKDYDVRKASFYRNSNHRRGLHWGAPYVDATTDARGDDLVLPCTKGIWSPAGAFLGVAGVEMTVTKMVGRSMTMQTRATIRASLVDHEGRKVIDSGDADRRFFSEGNDEAIQFTPFDLDPVAAAISKGREGIVDAERDGKPIVVAFVRLDAIGWYYVVEVDAASLGERSGLAK